MKKYNVKVTATITKWFEIEAEDEDEATEAAYEDFDCQPSVTEKYWQEVESVEEIEPTPTDEERSLWPGREGRMSLSQFIEYCLSFYGPGGVYPLGMSEDEITKAIRLLDLIGQKELDLDSIDRERVRDVSTKCLRMVMRGTKVSTKWEI
jgi:hypothetical protein